MRNEQDATSFYEMVKIRADQLSLEEPSLPRKRKVLNQKRIKKKKKRLNHTMCLNIHTERLTQINLKEILNEFVDSSDRRKKVFAKFLDQ